MRFVVFAALSLSVLGCRHHFPLPYTTTQLAKDASRWPGDALVHYVGQQNADLAVCSATPPTSLTRVDDDLIDPFVKALDEATLTPERWQACATQLVPTLPPPLREYTLSRLAKLVLSLLEASGTERLLAIHEVFASRPREPSPSLDALMRKMLEWPREKLAPALPPVFAALVITLELDHGQLDGHPLAASDIANTQDEALLVRMSERLPDEALRTGARRRLVQLRIARSDVREVRERAAEVEDAVVRTGRWAQPLASLRLTSPSQPMSLPFTGLLTQDIAGQVVSMLAPGDKQLQVAPTLDLKPTLRFSVGWSVPLALCGPESALVVEPCIDARDVVIENPAVKFDAEGVLRLPERMPMSAAFDLARTNEGLVLPVRLHGQLVTSLQVPLRFLEPQAYYFTGARGQPGPAVNVAVIPLDEVLLFEGVSEDATRRLAILPRASRGVFEFGSQGGAGFDGQRGMNGYTGSRGYNGTSASCPSSPGQPGGRGGDGGRGGPGGPGGPGGEGGTVNVDLRCGGACSQADLALVRAVVRSKGGRGGYGGSGGTGGSGGDGGSAGSGTSCMVNGYSTYVSGGSSGSSGSRGSDGPTGYSGPNGADGPVRLNTR